MKNDVVALFEEIRNVCRGYSYDTVALASLTTLCEALDQIPDDARQKFMLSSAIEILESHLDDDEEPSNK